MGALGSPAEKEARSILWTGPSAGCCRREPRPPLPGGGSRSFRCSGLPVVRVKADCQADGCVSSTRMLSRQSPSCLGASTLRRSEPGGPRGGGDSHGKSSLRGGGMEEGVDPAQSYVGAAER